MANSKLGQASARTIAEILQVDRAEIYRAMIKLEKLGLTQRCLTQPLTFRAIPITDATSILLQRETERRNKIEAELEKIIDNFREQNNVKPSQKDSQYRIIVGDKAEIREFLRDITETQTSRDSIFDWKLGLNVLRKHYDHIAKALKRGVKMRSIQNMPKGVNLPKDLQALMTMGSLEIKVASIVPNAGMSISDKERAAIIMLSKYSLKGIEVIRLKNPALVGLLQDYFEMKWQAATTL